MIPASILSVDATFETPLQISQTDNSVIPDIAISGNTVFTVWTDSSNGNNEIFFSASQDGGSTFGTRVNLSNSDGQSSSPHVASSGNNVYVIWSDNTTGNREIYLAKSQDGGSNYNLGPSNLSSTPGHSDSAQIAVSASNVYVVWVDNSEGNMEIYLARSSDNGTNFVTTNISSNPGHSVTPQIAVSASNVYVVWVDNSEGNMEIYLARSSDNGTNFVTTNISNSPDGASYDPQIAASGNVAYVIYSDDGYTPETATNLEVIFARIDASSGNIMTTDLSADSGSYSYTPTLAADVNNVYVSWNDDRDGNFDVYFLKSSDQGISFNLGETLNLSDPLGLYGNLYTSYQKVAAAGNNVYVTWQQSNSAQLDNSMEIFVVRSTNGGSSFENSINVSTNNGQSFLPKVVTTPNGAYIAWHEDDAGNFNIFSTNDIVVDQQQYQFVGFLQPINSDGSSIFKLGSTVPVKFKLYDSSGLPVSNAVAYLYLAKISDSLSGTRIEASSNDQVTTGNQFRYDAATNTYIYNLGTKNLSDGTWKLKASIDDGSEHTVIISLKN